VAAADEVTPLAVVLTPGQSGDAPICPILLDTVPNECPVSTVIADKAFDSDAIRADLERRGIKAVIPPLACRKEPIPYDKPAYKGRNRVERLFSKLKQFRRIATRYDKLDRMFLTFIHLAAALIMVR
jgi:transposase